MRWNRQLIALGAAGALLTPAGCATSDAYDPVPAGVATSIVAASGDRQTAEVGRPLPAPIVAKVADQGGRPVEGVAVNFAIEGGGGRLSSPTALTDSHGMAAASWTMGYSASLDPPRVRATLPGDDGPGAEFTATAVLSAGTLAVLGGDGQTTAVGTPLPDRPTVKVMTPEPGGVPVSGVVVRWEVVGGGGTAESATSTSGPGGLASVSWVVGTVAGTNNQVLRASIPSLAGASPASPWWVEFTATAVLPPAAVSAVSGDSQVGVPGAVLTHPLVVEVRNTAGEPVPGAWVFWRVIDPWDGWGGPPDIGTFLVTPTVTDAAGRAQAQLRLGTWLGTYTVVAGVTGTAGARLTFSTVSGVIGRNPPRASRQGGDQVHP